MNKKAWINIYSNERLDHYDLLIDLAEIKTLSKKMYDTGKISKKTLKKWHSRERKNIYGNRSLNSFKKCDHLWLPERVFKTKFGHQCNMFMWRCSRCRSSCNYIFTYEASETYKNDSHYSQFIKEPPTQEELNELKRKFSSVGNNSEETDSRSI